MTDVTVDMDEVAKVTPFMSELTEDNLALAFAEKHKNELRYCHTRGAWYCWNGIYWQLEQTQLAFHWAREFCRQWNRQNDKAVAKVRTAGAVERFAMADRRFAVTGEKWNRDPWLLATPAGTVELTTGKIRAPDPADHITLCTSVGPGTGIPERWTRFLDQVTNGDKDLQRFLQQVAGYCLTGITREHALFFLYGPGGNGKGVFVNTMSRILGEYAIAAAMDTFTASRYDRHPTDLADLAGARLVTASETEEGRSWAESRVKQLTGGDPVKARFMRQDFFQYQPEFKLVFLGNHKPVLQNVDEAARRRFNIIPFTHKPENPDPELPDKLQAEYGRILMWMIAGCLDWQENGLQRPAVVLEATGEYFAEQDLFTQWLEECTETCGKGAGERTTILFKSWKQWAEAAGDDPGSRRSFRDSMRSHGFEWTNRLPPDHKNSGFMGVMLKPAPDRYTPYAD